jgi:hypothetical protein
MNLLTTLTRLNQRVFSSIDKAFSYFTGLFQRGGKQMEKAIHDNVQDVINQVVKNIKARHSTPYSDSYGDNLFVRRGGIHRVKGTVKGSGVNTVGEITVPRHIYFHEKGGVIYAKDGKYLAIPLRSVLTSRGVPIYSSPREIENTFVFVSRSGQVFIAARIGRGKGQTFVPLYLLTKSVTIPPRFRLHEEFEKQSAMFIGNVMHTFTVAMGV